VDQAKVAFLFGEPPEWADPDNPEDRGGLLSELFEDDEETSPERVALYETIANQVANDDPPEVWETAQRLLGLGLDRRKVLSDLVVAMVPQLIAGVAESQPYDYMAHKAALAALPLPGPEEVVEAMVSVVREHQPIASEVVVRMAAERLNVPAEQEPHRTFIEYAFDQAIEDEDLEFATPFLVVDPSSFSARTVLTHRVTADERDEGYLQIGVDLALFEQVEFARGAGGVELEDFWSEDAGLAWRGPDGWLDPFPVGSVFAATANDDGTAISIEVLALPPAVDEPAVAALRAAYDECVEEIDLPVSIRQLVLALLARDRHFFDEPRAPVRELVAAAGLERRADEVAHSPELWRRDDELRQYRRVLARFDDLDEADAAISVITLFNEGDWGEAHRMREALSVLSGDAGGAEVVASELLGPELDESAEIAAQAGLAARFAERLMAVARKPTELALARWLMALADERSGDVLGAEAQLHIAAEVSSDWGPAVDRLAWYLSDKGEADEAARLWRSIGVDEDDPRLHDLEPAAAPVERPGRNEPCWCGSGRKYKTCHVGKPVLAPLPERLPWLARKAVSYLKRQSALAVPDIVAVASARAGGDTSEQALGKALSDPLTLDLVLNEGGWFERFLEDRGPLLPDDEALLAASWLLVDRTIYELLSVRPGTGMTVKDLRSAEEIEVRERTFSHQASPGMLVCARAVPDGQAHQLLGGLFHVRVGTEAALLDLLDEADPEAIAEWVADLERPPVLITREREPTVLCKAVVEVPDEALARQVLDSHYRAHEGATWDELFEFGPDEYIVRATLLLDGSRLTIEANSEERMDRVLGVLETAIPELEILADERTPLDLAKARRSSPPGPVPAHPPGATLEGDDADSAQTIGAPRAGGTGASRQQEVLPVEVRQQLQERFEKRWCDEHVPALGGITPRDAAVDPSRREALERLLAELERANLRQPEEAIAMRPARLRKMLGLS
jgi:SEC-C motif